METLWKVAHDDEDHRLLWAIDVGESIYRCRTWPVDDAELALLNAWNAAKLNGLGEIVEPEFLAHPDESASFKTIGDAFDFFAPEYDLALRTQARGWLSKLDPAVLREPI
ncbi:MAG: hypothetical protein ABI411_18615 [Tahibacter sp.]